MKSRELTGEYVYSSCLDNSSWPKKAELSTLHHDRDWNRKNSLSLRLESSFFSLLSSNKIKLLAGASEVIVDTLAAKTSWAYDSDDFDINFTLDQSW